MPSWFIEPLASHHDRAAFSCGKEMLDRYLREHASQDARRHVAVPFVVVGKPGDSTIFGYYTLSAFGIDPGALPEAIVKKLPRYPLSPAMLLGRLAVDSRWHGQGVGKFLLIDALHRAFVQSTQNVAAAFLIVDAIDQEALRFYRHFDCIPFAERRDRLFLPMSTIAALFAKL